jgi:hypothetical protein
VHGETRPYKYIDIDIHRQRTEACEATQEEVVYCNALRREGKTCDKSKVKGCRKEENDRDF